jgi:hypothetical protein
LPQNQGQVEIRLLYPKVFATKWKVPRRTVNDMHTGGRLGMLVVLQFLAVVCCTLFAGAAIYINLVEHPARMGCDTKTAATA